MLTTVIDVVELAREGIKMKRKNVTMSSRQKNLNGKLVKLRDAKRTMRCQIAVAGDWQKLKKAQLINAWMVHQKQTDEPTRTEVDLRVELVAVDESFHTKNAVVEGLEQELANKVEK